MLIAGWLLCASVSAQHSECDASEHGRTFKAEMRGAAPHRREAARVAAVRAYRAGARAGGTAQCRALCGLRAGELLLAAGLDEPGVAALMASVTQQGEEWSERAWLAAGAALIASGHFEEAARYMEERPGARAPSRVQERARVLRGVALASSGEVESALRVWREVALTGVTPRARVDAFERWGSELLRRGDVAGAAGVLHQCRSALSLAAAAETTSGLELRRRLRLSSLARSIRRALRAG